MVRVPSVSPFSLAPADEGGIELKGVLDQLFRQHDTDGNG